MILKIKGNKIWFSAVAVLFVVTIITTVIHLTSINNITETFSDNISPGNSKNAVTLSEKRNTKFTEIKNMRGVWVPYMSLETERHTGESFKSNFDNIVKTAISNKLNTLIVHVRPFSDALYKSDIFPTSHIVAETQGDDIDFDPMEYMIKKCHENNLKFHAWINPYRISTNETPSQLSESNIIYSLSDDDILAYDGGKYINPCSTKGRQFIIDGVKEIVKNYDIDGLQFDDYFYPSSDTSLDQSSYENYLSTLDGECAELSHTQWRKVNVNMLISSVYSAIKNIKSDLPFGISPQGNIDNCIEIGADVNTWCENYGYMDYICPQMYVNFEHSVLPFDKMLSDWKEVTVTNKVSLCVGLALYKAGSDSDEGTWQNKDDILKSEVEYCKKNGIDNFIIYDIDYFNNDDTYEEVKNVISLF